LALAWATSVFAQPALPVAAPSDAVIQGRRLLDALTGAEDDAAFLGALHALSPASKMTDAQWLDARPIWRRFIFHGVGASSPTEAELQVFDPGREDWARFLVTVEPAPPHAITRFEIHGSPRPADVPAPPKLAPSALTAAVRADAAEQTRLDRFSGVVLVSRYGRPVLQEAYGLADRERHAPVTLQTKLRIGSMGKMFTTIAILQLAQAGKLDLAAPISRYLSDFPNRQIAETATVDELVNHAAGLGDFFGPDFEAHRTELVNPEDYIARFGGQPALFLAGTAQAYSNLGYIVLGRIVEVASGQPYDRYVQDHIFKPAGMTGSGYLPETTPVPGRAVGYATGPDGRLAVATRYQVYRGTPAGGSYSTGADLMRFADALLNGRLLNRAWLDRLLHTGTKLPNGATSYYDFAGRRDGEGRAYYGHGGAAPGQNGVLHIFPDSGYTVVVLANRDPPSAEHLARFIEDRLP
jgi:CubicO group peptidase (beta-lactamase class C family)